MLSRGCDDAHLMFACVSDALLAGAVLRHRFASFLARIGCLSKRWRRTSPSLAAASADGSATVPSLSNLPFFLLAVQMKYDTSLSTPTARYSQSGNGWKATGHLAPLLRHGWRKAVPTSRRCQRNRTFALVAMSQFSVRVWRVASLKANLLQNRSKP